AQSAVLGAAAVQIGAVTAVTGNRGFDATRVGIANHAGAAPTARRRAALAAAAQLMAARRRAAPTAGAHAAASVGPTARTPGAPGHRARRERAARCGARPDERLATGRQACDSPRPRWTDSPSSRRPSSPGDGAPRDGS